MIKHNVNGDKCKEGRPSESLELTMITTKKRYTAT